MLETTQITPQSDWESASPALLGLNEGALISAGDSLARSASNARAFLVVRRGHLVWEQYYHGGELDQRMHLFSITKSVVSALIGIGLDHGLLSSIDQPLLDFFPEFACLAGNPFRFLTLHHLLTMTSGLVWPSGHHGLEPMVERMRRSPDWTQFILNLPVRRADIGLFHYSSANSHLLSALLTRACGQSACDFANTHLFDPLGIAKVTAGSDWEAAPLGVSTGGWGLHLTAREVARFGWLYLCGGQWRGRQIVSKNWVLASTQAAGAYGRQWWLRLVAGHPVFAGIGYGGQYLFCVPDLELEVVILSQVLHHWPDRWECLASLLAGLSA